MVADCAHQPAAKPDSFKARAMSLWLSVVAPMPARKSSTVDQLTPMPFSIASIFMLRTTGTPDLKDSPAGALN